MSQNDPQAYALESYNLALSFFRARHFAKAQQKLREYKRYIEYASFQCFDNRSDDPPKASVIIITRDRSRDLLSCLESLSFQTDKRFEIIVADNGGNGSLHDVLLDKNVLLVECPIPFTPSEGRNIAVFHSRGDLLIFLDDDALADTEFVSSALQAFDHHQFLGIRGKILPKSSKTDHSLAGVYDLGDYPLPALLDIEGNMAVLKNEYLAVDGMNPLLFGAEGLDLTTRLLKAQPEGEVFYWPGMIIRHDYASGDQLLAKRQRQALVNEYFRVMNPHVLKVKKRYDGLYRLWRKEMQGPILIKTAEKLKTVGRDICLALKSERRLYDKSMHPETNTAHSSSGGDMNLETISKLEANKLLQRISELESELEVTHKSLTFRLGQLIRDAISFPLRQGLPLPIRIFRLVKEYHTRKEPVHPENVENIHIPGREMRNNKQYTKPGREEHVFDLFEEFEPFRQNCNSNLRIACILSPWLEACLNFEAELIPLRLEDWKESIQAKRPDFLLVQPLLERSGSWKEYCSVWNDRPENLDKLTAFCKREGIPTVFWDTEDHIHYPIFSHIAPSFDRVFAADPKSVKEYSTLLGRNVVHLGPAVQPALHNPFTIQDDNHTGFTLLLDGWADILEAHDAFDFLKPLFNEGLHIIESRYRLMANKLDDLPPFRQYIMGCVSYWCRLNVLRHYSLIVMPERTLSSVMTRSWQALEATACGCTVVISGRQKLVIPEDVVIKAADDRSLLKKTLALIKDEGLDPKKSHVARRKIFSAHTYAHRIKAIADSLEVEDNWQEFPKVSIILPTKRPKLIQACIETFHNQNYPNKELVIIVNTNTINMELLRNSTEGLNDVQIFQLHDEKNIGICLNFGIAQASGKYWFKFDDDDFYGPNYLLDMVHLTTTSDFHIMGKPPAFIYLEDKDKLFLRNRSIQSQYTIGFNHSTHLCGATLGGKRDFSFTFSENHRACVDTAFVEHGKHLDRTLITGDIWNFIAFRARDKGVHTWRHDDEGIIKNSRPYCNGRGLEKVMI